MIEGVERKRLECYMSWPRGYGAVEGRVYVFQKKEERRNFFL